MEPEHPFDATLLGIDPQTHRITKQELDENEGGEVNISLLVVAQPLMVLDLTIHNHGGLLTLTCPSPLPILLAGTGVHPDGSIEPYAFAGEPCHCPAGLHSGTFWNPLSLALLWHPGLPPKVGVIMKAYIANILESSECYCEYGLDMIAATLG